MRCVNENCPNEKLDEINSICVTIDGDFVCDHDCKLQYEKQRDYFFGTIMQSEVATKRYLLGK